MPFFLHGTLRYRWTSVKSCCVGSGKSISSASDLAQSDPLSEA